MKRLAVFLADGFEECEALVLVDLCRRAGIDVDMLSINDQTGNLLVASSHMVTVRADGYLSGHQPNEYDVIYLPGGKVGVDNLARSELVKSWIQAFVDDGKTIVSVCAGPSVLSRYGYLDGKTYTCYPGFENYGPNAHYTANQMEHDGIFLTGNGLGACYLVAKELIIEMVDETTAQKVFDAIQYRGN